MRFLLSFLGGCFCNKKNDDDNDDTAMSVSQPASFFDPEFGNSVFNRILSYDKKDGCHQLRQLNKSFKQKFDNTIDTAKVEFSNLQQLVTSKFANQIQLLTVQIPDNLRRLDDLHLISPINLPNIQKVNVYFIQTDENGAEAKEIQITQALILRGLNVVSYTHRYIYIIGGFDVSITDSYFQRVRLVLQNSNNIFVKNTAFKYSQRSGLSCYHTSNKIKMENVEFLNCDGLCIWDCSDINITGFKAENCNVGVYLWQVNELNMADGSVENCREGIQFWNSNNSKIQHCIVRGCETGIKVSNSNVRYSRVRVEKKGDTSWDHLVINGGEFTEIF